jgi:hypothetical protein
MCIIGLVYIIGEGVVKWLFIFVISVLSVSSGQVMLIYALLACARIGLCIEVEIRNHR